MDQVKEDNGDYYLYNHLYAWETCSECETFRAKDICQHCSQGVCSRKKCCNIFPHKNNNQFIVCNTCSNEIEDNFVLVIKPDELRLLKQKIKGKIAMNKSS